MRFGQGKPTWPNVAKSAIPGAIILALLNQDKGAVLIIIAALIASTFTEWALGDD